MNLCYINVLNTDLGMYKVYRRLPPPVIVLNLNMFNPGYVSFILSYSISFYQFLVPQTCSYSFNFEHFTMLEVSQSKRYCEHKEYLDRTKTFLKCI